MAQLSIRARLTWIGLWTYCDDYGRGDGRVRMIYAAIYPVDPRETLASVSEDLDELSAAGRIVRYTVAGKEFIQIVNWPEHQRVDKPGKSRIPGPEDADSEDLHAQSSRDSRETVATSPENSSAGSRTLDLGTEDLGPRSINARAARETFEKFWTVYPRKAGKRSAETAWGRAITRADPELIIKAAVDYRDDPNRVDEYTAHPSTWLNQDRWNDDPLPARGGGRPSQTEKSIGWLTVGRDEQQPDEPPLRAIEGGS